MQHDNSLGVHAQHGHMLGWGVGQGADASGGALGLGLQAGFALG